MTDDTVTDPIDRSTDPTRFAAATPGGPGDDRHLGEVLGSAVALLLLLIGLPAALLVLAGAPPIPTSVPSARDFAQQLSFEDLVTVLVAVLWLTWLWFVVCVVVEVLAARRGGLARSIPLGGPLQRLARVLVGALLLTGIMAGQAQAVEAPPSQATTSVASIVAAELPPAVSAVESATDVVTADQVDHVGEKVYTVKAPKDGYHDNLWDIAERHLGEGRRYHEIYELNKDAIQADGGKLELARLIQPGWELVMPDDAVGIERVAAPAPAPSRHLRRPRPTLRPPTSRPTWPTARPRRARATRPAGWGASDCSPPASSVPWPSSAAASPVAAPTTTPASSRPACVSRPRPSAPIVSTTCCAT